MINEYKNYSPEQVEELLSNYLIDSWSFSRVSTFARNEKEFEMRYLYNVYSKSSASSVGGQAYHEALEYYFGRLKTGEECDIIDMQLSASAHIENIPAYQWKLQKTRPTVQACIEAATKNAYKGIENFMAERDLYIDNIKNIEGIELAITDWIVVNGVSIPLPVNMRIDLVAETEDGKRVIIDHKLRSSYTAEEDVQFVVGKQAVIYTLGYEAHYEETIDEVWFVENKISTNRDGSKQLNMTKIVMDIGTRRLYEAMLYEPLRRMIEAAGDPDYIYMINDTDNYTSKAELYDFWAKTMLDEIESFEIAENKKELMKKRQRKIKDSSLINLTPSVLKNFKSFTEQFIPYDFTNKDMTNEQKIEHVLRSFGMVVQVAHTFEGHSSTTYLIEITAGVAVASIKRYRLDIASALSQPNVRIGEELTVWEGKSYVSIEAGKKSTSTLMWDKTKLHGLKLPIGEDNFGKTVSWNLDNHSTPHMLVCGATGSGKSVMLKSTIMYAIEAGVKDIYVMDPKFEFLYLQKSGVTVISDIAEIEKKMAEMVKEMEERIRSGAEKKTLIIFDEFADAVAQARKGNELNIYENVIEGVYANGKDKIKRVTTGKEASLEENLKILLQKGRSSGFRIVAATQRASTKVITGDAKVNFPVAVCFRVPKDIDSMVVLDEPGAESLDGRGDGLIKSPEYRTTVRFQGYYHE